MYTYLTSIRSRFHAVMDEREKGASALEYVGIILIAALIVGGIWTALSGVDVTGSVSDAVNDIFNSGG